MLRLNSIDLIGLIFRSLKCFQVLSLLTPVPLMVATGFPFSLKIANFFLSKNKKELKVGISCRTFD